MDPPENQSSPTPLISARGFTFIELIVVMLLMAILAAIAGSRFFGRGDFEAPGFTQEIAAAARYAQKLAVNSGCPVRLSVPDTTSYELLQPQNAPAPSCNTVLTRSVLHPGTGAAFAGTAPAGVTIGGTVPLTVDFGATGAPAIAADVEIQVGAQRVVITAGSGYVEIR